jgi:hypothetical protein
MKHARLAAAIYVSIGLVVLFGIASASAGQLQARWIGPGSCGSWTQGLAVGKGPSSARDNASLDNMLILDWTLGMLSGEDDSPLTDVDVPSVASWIDTYCGANPLAKLPEVAISLRNEILKRRSPAK